MIRRPLAAMTLALSGCEGVQNSLHTQGPAAAEIAGLWWWMLLLTGVPAAITIAAIVFVVVQRRTHRMHTPDLEEHPGEAWTIVVLGAVITPIILMAILLYSLGVGLGVHTPRSEPALTIEVIGHQFWWEIRYPELGVVDANELHIPAGRPVALRLSSVDVIHSFWVPNLHGKQDMMPGSVNTFWLQADAPGVYRGQCAEFCGIQHALMAFEVVAHPPETFEQWAMARRQTAGAAIADPRLARGVEVWFEARCDQCHAITGLPQQSPTIGTGPDLTHLASRRMLAGATLPNNRGNLYGWLLDPQHHKPGVRMPASRMPQADLDALVALLEAMR